MGDLPSSSVQDDQAMQDLVSEIEQLQEQHEHLMTEQRQWQQRRQVLWQVMSTQKLAGLAGGADNGKDSIVLPKTTITTTATISLQDQLQTLLQTAHHCQQEALEDFRSTLSRRKSLTETSNLARESKALYDAFHIGYQGPFATINGLRLGAEAIVQDHNQQHRDESGGSSLLASRVSGMNGSHNDAANPGSTTIKVPWSEINSALGLLALLLSSLEQKPHTGIRYKHEIVCCGSTSKIGIGRREGGGGSGGVASSVTSSSSSSSYYNLYSDDSFQFFGRRNFNTALQCLVQCVADAAEAIQRRDPTIHLPHPIDKTTNREVTVGGLPVAYGADGVEWTRAMKYLLTNVKHLTAYRAFGLWDVVLDN